MEILKYPRTRHLEGSRLQKGDMADDQSIAALAGQSLVVEEKIDGANCAVSFDEYGQILFQSRGHYLTGGYRERHFDLLKTWGHVHAARFWQVLADRYIMYGEWVFAKHTVFYDRLPHYFLEFDVFDKEKRIFLSTKERHTLLGGLPIMPVPVVFEGPLKSVDHVQSLIGASLYKSPDWREKMQQVATETGSRMEFVEQQTEDSDLAEGLYLKLEEEGRVAERFKFVRHDFLQTITESGGHWQSRPILPNQLANGVDIFGETLGLKGAYDDPSTL